MIDRPHVEFICADTIEWTERAAPFAAEPLSMRVLVAEPDAGNGAAIARLPAGFTASEVGAPFELIVLEGALEVDDRTLGRHGYLSALPGAALRLSAPAGALVFFDAIADVDTTTVEPWSEEGFVKASMPGLERKIIRHVDGDARGWFLRIPAGWTMERTEWHDCAEASFRLEGSLWHDRANGGAGGTMWPHCYFWRPAHGLHGPMGSNTGSLSWVYVDGHLVSHFVEDEGEPPAD